MWNKIANRVPSGGKRIHFWERWYFWRHTALRVSTVLCLACLSKPIGNSAGYLYGWYLIYVWWVLFFHYNVLSIIAYVSNLSFEQIRWENRLTRQGLMLSDGRIAYVSVDGTDCQIREAILFNRKFYSHKFRGPGLRHEIGISIFNGHTVWAYGPFPCGSNQDVQIFRWRMKNKLFRTECIVTDNWYRDNKCFTRSDCT